MPEQTTTEPTLEPTPEERLTELEAAQTEMRRRVLDLETREDVRLAGSEDRGEPLQARLAVDREVIFEDGFTVQSRYAAVLAERDQARVALLRLGRKLGLPEWDDETPLADVVAIIESTFCDAGPRASGKAAS